ncbi:hypothetical protein BGW41_005556 [Actinomortierella wolfii]|nr:hypothetical protein BGW41_005556 [Actinomortierella wolfii]
MADMDPRKLKVNELKEQLQLAGLPTTGKKEELVARLLEHQKQDETDDVTAVVAPPTGTGDNFDWENDEVALPPSENTAASSDNTGDAVTTGSGSTSKATSASAAPTSSDAKATAATSTSAKNDAAPATATVTAPATTSTTATATTGGAKTAEQEALLAEFEKRKNRAARFGIPLTEQDKALERAARFGVPVSSKVASTVAATTKKASTPATTTTTTPAAANVRGGKVDPIKSIQLPQEVLNKRAERFGIQPKTATTTTTSTTSTNTAGNKPSLYKLDEAEEEKKRKRAAKFGMPEADDASKKVKV